MAELKQQRQADVLSWAMKRSDPPSSVAMTEKSWTWKPRALIGYYLTIHRSCDRELYKWHEWISEVAKRHFWQNVSYLA